MNPFTCGVAKFNQELAKRLGIPCVGFYGICGPHPLLSLKWSEITDVRAHLPDVFSVFWHDAGAEWVTARAKAVYYADPSLGSPGLWCPSLLPPPAPRVVRLFSFGMAHKLQTAPYAKVRSLLERAGVDYRLRVSVGIHEGTSLDDATQHFDALREIMGAEKVTVVGILSDEAVAEELRDADYVLAFFEQGLRANNTTVQAAVAAGCEVLSNLDALTPQPMARLVADPMRWTRWPFRERVETPYTWDALVARLQEG
jgi:hypothetical protein